MKRIVIIASCFVLAVALGILVFFRSGHVGDLKIKITGLAEEHSPSQLENALALGRRILHLAAVDTRVRKYLTIGSAQMEWSLMSQSVKTGWLYFARPESNEMIWEFGPCARSTLRGVSRSDLEVGFVRAGNTNGIRSSFNADSWVETSTGLKLENGAAIPVKVGQVILARLVKAPDTIYAMHLVYQGGAADWGSISVEYVEIDTKRPSPGGSGITLPFSVPGARR